MTTSYSKNAYLLNLFVVYYTLDSQVSLLSKRTGKNENKRTLYPKNQWKFYKHILRNFTGSFEKKSVVPLKECITSTNDFGNKHSTLKIIARIMDDCRVKVRVKVNTIFFKEWMAALLSATELDTLIQRMDDC